MGKKPVVRLALCFLLGCCLGLGFISLQRRYQAVNGGFIFKEGFPRLVYVVDYQKGPRISAASAVLIEAATGTILYAHNEHLRRAPASTTKVLTALLALERADLRSQITVSRRAALTPGSTAGLHPGDRFTLEELLQGLMLCSGNDAAVAIAEYLAGSVNDFAGMMNRRARECGAFNSNFRNPHGLPAVGHFTTAFDLALITRYALQYPAFSRLVRTREEDLQRIDQQRRVPIGNTNRLLWSFAGADGVKTGTTAEAGHCLVASATRDGRQLIAVVLRSGNRWGDAAALLDYGFKEFELLVLASENRTAATVTVKGGTDPTVELVPRRRLAVVCRKGCQGMIELKAALPQQAPAPVRSGAIIGRLTAYYDGEEIDGVDLLSRKDIARNNWWRRLWD